MFPFFSLLILSQIFTAFTDLVEEKQYINDLKEDAKKEFIDRVVRRLAQEVDLKDAPIENSKKMTDDQLDKHNDFVKKIINEEKADFEKEKHDEVHNKAAFTELRRMSNESHIELTLKEQTRKKRHENDNKATTEVNEVTIPVQTIYDVDPNKGSESPVNNSSNVGKDDIQVKGQILKTRRSAQKEENENPETETTSDSSTHLYNHNGNEEKLVLSDNSKESNEVKTLKEDSEGNKSTVASLEDNTEKVKSTKDTGFKEDETSSRKPFEAVVVTAAIDNGELSDQNKVFKDSKPETKSSNEEYLKNNESVIVTHKVKVSDRTSIPNLDAIIVTETFNKENVPNVTKKKALRDDSLVQSSVLPEAIQKEAELYTHPTTISESETTTLKVPKTVDNLNKPVENIKKNKINDFTLNYNPYKPDYVAENKTSKLRSEKVKIVKVGPSSRNILRSKLPTVKLKDVLNWNVPTKEDDNLRTVQIAEDIVKALRVGIERDKKISLRTKPNLKRKEVNIYGLRSFVEDKSLESDDRNREEPYYAPIYNYDPKSAYYNAYNKFGPNFEDSKNHLVDRPQETDKVDIQNLPLEEYARSFFKKPLKLSKKIEHRKPRMKKVNIDRILPFVVKKPYKLPLNDYEEFLGDDYKEKNIFRSGSEIKEADDTLKNHLRHVRKSIFLRKDDNKNDRELKNEEENRGTGWLDEGVNYYFNNLKNLAKPIKPYKGFHSINYDYLGETRSDTNKLRRNPKLRHFFDHVPIPTSHLKNSSREVITRISKLKNKSDSKELIETFQKVFPLLKNLVQIVDDDVDEEVEACIKVLKDMINRNDEGLEQYDWLESTVNIQSAIRKLLFLTRAASEDLRLHPADVELLKFTTYLFSIASEELRNGAQSFKTGRARSPKSNTAKGHYVNHKQLLEESKKWLYRVPSPKNRYSYEYTEMRRFLNDLSDNLFDLHDALKHVSLVTKFKSQRWYGNLKDLYLHDPDRKKLLQVLLHLGTTRLFNLIEDASKNGVEEDFRRYILENQSIVTGVRDAYVFILKVLQTAVFSKQ